MSKYIVISNGGSGRASETEQLRALLVNSDATWLDLAQTDDLAADLQAGLSSGCKTVVAAGGDGTVNATVNALMSLDSHDRPSMAIIPLGTANDFAGTLGVPDDIREATRLLDQTPTGVDVVKIAGEGFERYYANIAAGGNCVRVSEAMTDEIKSRWGAFSYMRGAVDVLPDMETFRMDVQCDEEHLTDLPCWAVLVANGKTTAGRIAVAPKALPADGLFDVIIIRDGTFGDMLEIVANNLLGSFLECEQIIFRQARSLHLKSEPSMRFTIDGEVIDQEPVRFEIVPGAIAMHYQR